MRDGTTEGMQRFDGEIEKLIRTGVVEFETGVSYATNAGNLRLAMADFLDERTAGPLQDLRRSRLSARQGQDKRLSQKSVIL